MKKDNISWLIAIAALIAIIYFFFKKDGESAGGGSYQLPPIEQKPPPENKQYKFSDLPIINPLEPQAFRPYGRKSLSGELSRAVIERTGQYPGVLHDVFLKESFRRNPNWKYWENFPIQKSTPKQIKPITKKPIIQMPAWFYGKTKIKLEV
jgi:hypothetical protein